MKHLSLLHNILTYDSSGPAIIEIQSEFKSLHQPPIPHQSTKSLQETQAVIYRGPFSLKLQLYERGLRLVG